jgi:hypothetical protein
MDTHMTTVEQTEISKEEKNNSLFLNINSFSRQKLSNWMT